MSRRPPEVTADVRATVARAMVDAALRVLADVTPADLTPQEAIRLLDIGTRFLSRPAAPPPEPAPEPEPDESPLERIARELADTA